jgi:hypothetical protein
MTTEGSLTDVTPIAMSTMTDEHRHDAPHVHEHAHS